MTINEHKAYIEKRKETKKYMDSFTDSNGKIYTACKECVKECKNRTKDSGCMCGELKKELKKYL